MIHNIERIRKCLRLLYESLFTILVFIFISVVFLKIQPSFYVLLVIPVQYILSYIIRDYATGNIWTMLFHVTIGAMVFVLPIDRKLQMMLLIITLHLLSSSFGYARFGYKLKPLDDIPWPSFLISLIIYAYGYYMKEDMMLKGAYFIPVILLVIYYFMIYTDGLKVYVNATKDVSGLPLKKIIATNSMIVFVIVLFLVVGLILGNILSLDKALVAAGKGVVAVFKMAMLVIVFVWRLITSLMSGGSGTSNVSPVIMDAQPTREYATKIGDSFEIVIKGIVIVIALYIVYKVAIRIIKKLVIKRKYEGDIIETAEVSYGDAMDNVERKSFFYNRLTNEEKIRKYYKIRVLRHKYDISLTKQKTAREIETDFEEKSLGDIGEITDIYSEVRYGNTVPDKALVKKMNRFIKR